MRKVFIFLAIIQLFIFCCSENQITGNHTKDSEPDGSLVGYSGCKEFQSVNSTEEALSNTSCIEYQYDGEGVLIIKHVNAGFNCCPDEILAEIGISDNEIVIEEKEEAALPCPCLCLYDLEYEITDLQPGEYTIKVIEPHVMEGEDVLETSVDLDSSNSGSFCVERIHYPWNHETVDTTVSGHLIDYNGCKGSGLQVGGRCIEYQYLWNNLLLIRQTNVTLNCCVTFVDARIFIEGNVIAVGVEWADGLCFCRCPFDLDYEIKNLEPGEYVIRAYELYSEPFEFTVDLSSSPSGIYCAN